MANKDAAFGFRPVRHLTGGDLQANEYTIAANLGHDIFHGQCVKAVTAGGIERADAGDVILGVFGGCFFTDPTTSKPTFSNNIQQAQMLLILLLLYTTIQESSSKSSMMVQAQRQ